MGKHSSALADLVCTQVFMAVAKEVMGRLVREQEAQSAPSQSAVPVNMVQAVDPSDPSGGGKKKGGCC